MEIILFDEFANNYLINYNCDYNCEEVFIKIKQVRTIKFSENKRFSIFKPFII